MAFDPDPAAQALRRSGRTGSTVTPLPAEIAPATAAEGAAVQFALAELAGAVPPFGFKIGATGKRMQVYLGVDAPIAGFMRAQDVYHGHAELRFADYIKPGVECEVAVRLARGSAAWAVLAGTGAGSGRRFLRRNRDRREPLWRPEGSRHADTGRGPDVSLRRGDRRQHGVDWRALEIGALRGRISLDDGTPTRASPLICWVIR